MKRLGCCFALLFFLVCTHAQSTDELSLSSIDSLLLLYEKQPAKYAAEGIQLALKASQLAASGSESYGDYLEWTTVFYEAQGDRPNAIRYYKKALKVFEENSGIYSDRYAIALSFFGNFYLNMGDYDQALTIFTQVKEIRAKINGTVHDEYAAALNNLGALSWKMSDYHKALKLFTQAKDIRIQILPEEHPNFATSLNNLAVLHQRLGNYDQALLLYLQAKDIRAKTLGRTHPEFALSLNNLAALYRIMGNYDKALPLYQQARDIREETLGQTHPLFAASINSLASLYKDMGNYDRALDLYLQAKDIRAQVLGEAHPDFANSLNNLANLYQNTGNHQKALKLFRRAKDLREKALGPAHPDFANSLNNLASIHRTLGQYAAALPLLQQAKTIHAAAVGEKHPYFIRTLNHLAQLHQDMADYDQAWAYALQALSASTQQPCGSTIDAAWAETILETPFASNEHLNLTLQSLQFIYTLLEKDTTLGPTNAQQRIVADLATDLLTKLRHNVSHEKDKLRLLKESHQWLERSLKQLHQSDQSHEAFALADQNKSVLLLQASKAEQLYRMGNLPDSLVWQDKKLLRQQSQLQANLAERRPEVEQDSLRHALNQVNQALDALSQQIKTDYPKYHQLKYQQPTVDVAVVQNLLEEQTALLEYVISDSAVHIFYVDQQTVVWKQQQILKKDLKKRIQKLHQALSNHQQLEEDPERSYQIYIEQAYWFYTQLLAPVLADRSGIKNLVLVTDGELGHLPFEAFLVERAPQAMTPYQNLHYLLVDYNISYNYSAALWQENKLAAAPNNNGQLFGLAANYNLPLEDSLSGIRLPTERWARSTLVPLPGARKEVEILQEQYQGFFAFDHLASEKTVKDKAGDFAILHLATHGLLDQQRPLLSALALSEDHDPQESNFWQAHEISKMTLNANLVVLSACETGYGKFEQGNGIASLARSFMYAGAPSMVVSLWQVNDYATAQIMEYFYAHLADGVPIDQALRQAKLQYLKTATGPTAHPAFWSPFIHLGKTEPIVLQTTGLGLWFWGIGALGLLLMGGGWWWTRRRQPEVA